MTSPSATQCEMSHTQPSLLEMLRRREAEIKRRLASEREAAQAALAEAEKHADELIATAEAQGWREGEINRQAARAEAEREAEAIIAQARAHAERLQRLGTERMAEAVARALEMVVGVRL